MAKRKTEEIILELKNNYTIDSLIADLISKLTDTVQINSNTEEKNFRYDIYYKISAVLSIIKDKFENQDEIKDYNKYLQQFSKDLKNVISLLKKSAKRFADRNSCRVCLIAYAKSLEYRLNGEFFNQEGNIVYL